MLGVGSAEKAEEGAAETAGSDTCSREKGYRFGFFVVVCCLFL